MHIILVACITLIEMDNDTKYGLEAPKKEMVIGVKIYKVFLEYN